MTITTEKINGVPHTVVWHVDYPPSGTLGRRYTDMVSGVKEFFEDANCLRHIATALPPIPRFPQPDDAALLYRYCSDGVMPWIKEPNGQSFAFIVAPHLINFNELAPPDLPRVEITHATRNGERVDIAITEMNNP
jgi:hypothetical protein